MNRKEKQLAERPTVPMRREPTMVLVGYTPDGQKMFRPLTPGAARMLNVMTNQADPGADYPGLHAREAGVHRRRWPTWFLVGALVLLTAALGLVTWLVITIVSAVTAFIGLLAGHAALVIGIAVIGIGVLGALFGRKIIINQSVNL